MPLFNNNNNKNQLPLSLNGGAAAESLDSFQSRLNKDPFNFYKRSPLKNENAYALVIAGVEGDDGEQEEEEEDEEEEEKDEEEEHPSLQSNSSDEGEELHLSPQANIDE